MTDPMTLAFVTALNVMGLNDDAHEAAHMVNAGSPWAALIEKGSSARRCGSRRS